jgi:hypothetical protein
MTREQRDAAKQRLEVLRIADWMALVQITENMSDKGGIEIANIINETKAEIVSLEKTLATKWEFLFNFKGGGWNSEVAFTREDAIEQALFNYGHPDTQEHLRVDTSTFRVSTPTDYKSIILLIKRLHQDTYVTTRERLKDNQCRLQPILLIKPYNKRDMTKREMITAIQLQEAQAFLRLKEIEAEYGAHDPITKTARTTFTAVYGLMESLGIRSDFNLPETQRATDLILFKIKYGRAEVQ